MLDSGRHLELKPLGLPDPRGFTPHLRSIMLDRESFQVFRQDRAEFSGERRWIIHDLLHILFYDFAYLELGAEAFEDADRFFEVHLASEAFAVLALDYHILSQIPDGGLAVDFNPADWPKFQKLNPGLPHFQSSSFIEALVELYLSGKNEVFRPNEKAASEKFEIWAGHEIRYAEKQRLYVTQWRADLENKTFENKIPAIEESYAWEGVKQLVSLIIGEKKSWDEYTLAAKSSLKGQSNYFENLPKYKKLKTLDFRFTDFRAVGEKDWRSALEINQPPNPSQLFLFWQLAASISPWSEKELRVFGDLQKSANTKKINLDLWRITQEILIKNIPRIEALPPNPYLKGCFFLP